jgi:hypothetical protein
MYLELLINVQEYSLAQLACNLAGNIDSLLFSLHNLDFNLGCILDKFFILGLSTIQCCIEYFDIVLPITFVGILLAIASVGTLIYYGLDNILLTKAEDFIKGLKDLPEQEAIDKIRAELDKTMGEPITPESEAYMDSLNDELEDRTS